MILPDKFNKLQLFIKILQNYIILEMKTVKKLKKIQHFD